MQIKLELYRIFRDVAEKGNITAVAESLYISQSAVSQAIQQLEKGIGMPLFRRTKKGVLLTDEGRLLYEYAMPALNLIKTAEQKLFDVKNLSDGELKIGASDTISKYLLLDKLERFNHLYPKIKLRIINRTSLETVALLKEGNVDLAFFNLPLSDDEVQITEYLPVHDVFVYANGYDGVSPQRSYTPAEVASFPLILLEKKANSRLFIDEYFRQKQIAIFPEIELGSHDLLLEFAKIKLGVSCVTREFSRHYLADGTLSELKLKVPINPRSIGVGWLKGVSLSVAAEAFMKIE